MAFSENNQKTIFHVSLLLLFGGLLVASAAAQSNKFNRIEDCDTLVELQSVLDPQELCRDSAPSSEDAHLLMKRSQTLQCEAIPTSCSPKKALGHEEKASATQSQTIEQLKQELANVKASSAEAQKQLGSLQKRFDRKNVRLLELEKENERLLDQVTATQADKREFANILVEKAVKTLTAQINEQGGNICGTARVERTGLTKLTVTGASLDEAALDRLKLAGVTFQVEQADEALPGCRVDIGDFWVRKTVDGFLVLPLRSAARLDFPTAKTDQCSAIGQLIETAPELSLYRDAVPAGVGRRGAWIEGVGKNKRGLPLHACKQKGGRYEVDTRVAPSPTNTFLILVPKDDKKSSLEIKASKPKQVAKAMTAVKSAPKQNIQASAENARKDAELVLNYYHRAPPFILDVSAVPNTRPSELYVFADDIAEYETSEGTLLRMTPSYGRSKSHYFSRSDDVSESNGNSLPFFLQAKAVPNTEKPQSAQAIFSFLVYINEAGGRIAPHRRLGGSAESRRRPKISGPDSSKYYDRWGETLWPLACISLDMDIKSSRLHRVGYVAANECDRTGQGVRKQAAWFITRDPKTGAETPLLFIGSSAAQLEYKFDQESPTLKISRGKERYDTR